MNSKIFVIFTIISLILVIPSATAQEVNVASKAKQKSVEVTISEAGNVHVKHIISASSSPKQVELIDGTIENLVITNEDGEEGLVTIVGENDAVMILPSQTNSIVEYDLRDVLLLKDGFWTLDFLYLEKTSFIVPEKLDLIFVNNNPVNLDDKRGFTCHGCQMILEYSFDEPKSIQNVKWEDREFVVEINTFADIDGFTFDQPAKSITFDVLGENKFVTTVIPLELLWGPYVVFLDDEKILFHDYINNGTHVWLNIRPESSGEISIIGTTVVPEFSMFIPLIVGFLAIVILSATRKVNLH